MSSSDFRLRAFVPAAGYGERLLPITSYLPKPLLPVLGKPVLERVLDKLIALGISEIGINTHHLSDQIQSWLRTYSSSERISIFHEETLLGTGGALRNAAGFIGTCHVLVHNGDVLTSFDIQDLVDTHFREGNIATLAVHTNPRHRRLRLDNGGGFIGLTNPGDPVRYGAADAPTAFTGIAIYSPEFLVLLPKGVSHVVPYWLKAVEGGARIGTLDVTGSYWSDIGTPESYCRAVRDALDRDGEYIYVHPKSRGCGQAILQGRVVLEESTEAGSGTVLKNVIVLPGTTVRKGAGFFNCIVGPDFDVPISAFEEPLLQSGLPCNPAAVFPRAELNISTLHEIGHGGSQRNYFRASAVQRTVVLAVSDPDDPDFERHVGYTRFLANRGVRVPELIDVDLGSRMALFEDLGDVSLYTWMRCRRTEEDIERMYHDVLNLMARLHRLSFDSVQTVDRVEFRVFDRTYFRWESDYFLRDFVTRRFGFKHGLDGRLKKELDNLAERAASFPTTIIHRDFQSQNVMLATGAGEPVLIDYQGARIGPPSYDLASLLWDPYTELGPALRERLTGTYLSLRERDAGFDTSLFLESLGVCRIQRHMQALGAYGFLSAVRKKARFTRFIGPALRMLEMETNEVGTDCRYLHDLVCRVLEQIEPNR